MSLKEIVDVAGLAVGTGLFGLALNEARKQYVNWAEKNKFYDKGVKFNDLENKTKPKEYDLFSKTAAFYKPFRNMVNVERN